MNPAFRSLSDPAGKSLTVERRRQFWQISSETPISSLILHPWRFAY